MSGPDHAEFVQSEKVEKELNILIERRADAARQTREQERIDEAWSESAMRESLKERRKIRAAWYGFHEHMRETHLKLAGEHEAKAKRLLEEGVV